MPTKPSYRDAQLLRAQSQMTLGTLIAELRGLPDDTELPNFIRPHSYRGHYHDLAFRAGEGVRTAASLLGECEQAVGQTFVGYKGGEFIGHEHTPVWVAEYGCTGYRILALTNAQFVLASPEESV